MISAIHSTQIKQYPAYSKNYIKDKPSVSFGNKALKEFGINMGLATAAFFAAAGFVNALADHNIISENWVNNANLFLSALWVVFGFIEVIKLSKNFHKE